MSWRAGTGSWAGHSVAAFQTFVVCTLNSGGRRPSHEPEVSRANGAKTGVDLDACFYRRVLRVTARTQGWLSRYHCTVSRIPFSKVWAGVHPSSFSILEASMA